MALPATGTAASAASTPVMTPPAFSDLTQPRDPLPEITRDASRFCRHLMPHSMHPVRQSGITPLSWAIPHWLQSIPPGTKEMPATSRNTGAPWHPHRSPAPLRSTGAVPWLFPNPVRAGKQSACSVYGNSIAWVSCLDYWLPPNPELPR